MENNIIKVDKSIQNQFLDRIKLKENYKSIQSFYETNKSEILLEKYDLDKRTPLINSIVYKNFNALKFLIDNEIDINKTDSVFYFYFSRKDGAHCIFL